MRRFKFRVWDEDYCAMRHSGYYSDSDGELFKETFSNIGIEYACGECMYTTGLFDSDGIEIYEGDILEVDSREIGGDVLVGEVMWCDDLSIAPPSFGLWTKKGFVKADFIGKLRVIGNKFEYYETDRASRES